MSLQLTSLSVADSGGLLTPHVGLDGAWLGSIPRSLNRALSARVLGMPTIVAAVHGGKA